MARVRITGTVPPSSAVIVGAWDPVLPPVEKRVRLLAKRCRRTTGIELVPILLDPSPASILNPGWHPRFECAESRVARLLECGVPAVIRVALSKKDLEQGIRFFLDLLAAHTEVKAIFLARNQSLGGPTKGDPKTIASTCRQAGIDILESGISSYKYKREAYRLYRRNAFHAIGNLIGRPLCWTGRRDQLSLPLKPGRYMVRVAATQDGLLSRNCSKTLLDVNMQGQGTLQTSPASTVWIAPTRYLRLSI